MSGAARPLALIRAVTGATLRRLLLGRRRGDISVHHTMEIPAPVDEVFDFWSHQENFPRFMGHVRAVRRLSDERSRWTVAGPAGLPFEWETVVTRFSPIQTLAWQTVEGSPIEHEGSVEMAPGVGSVTRVLVTMAYRPPTGTPGYAPAILFAGDPGRALEDDLGRLRAQLEVEASSRGQSANWAPSAGSRGVIAGIP